MQTIPFPVEASPPGAPPETAAARLRLGAVLLACGALAFSTAGDVGVVHASEALEEPPITEADRAHWAFQPVATPPIPAVRDAEWPQNPIDRFILKAIEDAGLSPLPPADRATLLRRAHFALTGLPPTPDEIDAFLQDTSPDAWERLVDRLLASDAYGERWGQHWLDLARFAETDGFEHDHVRPSAWRYRDWVIDALNADMPYDEFVRLQIAGDLLHPDDPSAAVATGFLLCGPDMPDINLQEERRHNVLNEMTSAVGTVVLALTVGCAQCHDHKTDPVSQADFYRLRAFFETAEIFREHPLPGTDASEPDRRPSGRILRESGEARSSFLRLRGDFRRQGPEVRPAYLRIVNHPDVSPASERLPRAALADWITRPDHPLTGRVIVNRLWQHHFGRGIVASSGDFGVTGGLPSHPELLDWLATELPRRGWSLKSLHRLILTSATWQQAGRPTESGWSADERARALASWRQSLARDPDNVLLARMPRRRLEGEAIRDAMLAASARLTERRGGPGVRPPLPEELLVTLLKNQWEVTPNEADHRRRSVYLFVRRNLQFPFFDVFDKPDTNESCPRRNRSTIAPQALTLLNSDLSVSAARALAGRVLRECGPDPVGQVERCYRHALSRRPTVEELRQGVAFLEENSDRLRRENRTPADLALPDHLAIEAPPHQAAALVDFCLAIFNLNEFIYID